MTYQELPELLTIKQASQLINVHPNTLRNWEKEGKLTAVRIGTRRDRRFVKSSMVVLVNERYGNKNQKTIKYLF